MSIDYPYTSDNKFKIYEFSRGFHRREIDGQWVSGGYAELIAQESYSVPEEIQRAVAQGYFKIKNGYAPNPGDKALIAREFKEYSVLAVATRERDDKARYPTGYRYFWLIKSQIKAINSISREPSDIENESRKLDGVRTLLEWWIENKKPCFQMNPNAKKAEKINFYYDRFYVTFNKSACHQNIGLDLIYQVDKLGQTLLVWEESRNSADINYEEIHSLALQANYNKRPIYWAANVRRLEHPQRFIAIHCADKSAVQAIKTDIEKAGAAAEKSLFLLDETPQEKIQSENNAPERVRGILDEFAQNPSPETAKGVVECLSGEYEWEKIFSVKDGETQNNIPVELVRYKALEPILVPDRLWEWLSWVSKNKKYQKNSIESQKILGNFIKSRPINHEQFVNFIHRGISRCLVELTNSNKQYDRSIKWLLIQEKDSLWKINFKDYSNKLLQKLEKIANNQTDQIKTNEDIFFTKVFSALEEWKNDKEKQKKPEFRSIAKLLRSVEPTLSALFYHLSQKSVPQDVNRKSNRVLVNKLLDVSKKTSKKSKINPLVIMNLISISFIIIIIIITISNANKIELKLPSLDAALSSQKVIEDDSYRYGDTFKQSLEKNRKILALVLEQEIKNIEALKSKKTKEDKKNIRDSKTYNYIKDTFLPNPKIEQEYIDVQVEFVLKYLLKNFQETHKNYYEIRQPLSNCKNQPGKFRDCVNDEAKKLGL
ncbi:hypothetical protein ACE1CD_06495 [Aerosakkonema sp. BLCC-F183]